jgi:hypothetical protein
MEITDISIEFRKDDNNIEFGVVTVNKIFAVNKKGRLDKDLNNFGGIYPKVDKDNIQRSVLYRFAILVSLIKNGKIEFEL